MNCKCGCDKQIECKCGCDQQVDCDLCGDPLPKDHKHCKCCGRNVCVNCLELNGNCVLCIETENECSACDGSCCKPK